MKIYEWGDNTNWISCKIFKNKKKLLEHIRNVTHDSAAYGDKAYIYEIDTITEMREKIMILDLK